MFITIKMISQETFRIEAKPEDTVGVLKQKIVKERNVPPDDQKLIFGGKMLTDEETVKEIKINEKHFIVLMVIQKKGVTNSQQAKVATQTKAKNSSSQSLAKSVSKSAASSQSSQSGAAVEVSNEAKILSLVNMGFKREAVERALKVSENVVDQAVNILTEENAANDQNVPKQPQQGVAPQMQPQENEEHEKDDEAFQAVLSIYKDNPELLQDLLDQFVISYPNYQKLITANHQKVLASFDEQLFKSDQPVVDQPKLGNPPRLNPGPQAAIELNAQEHQVIERLVAIGFPQEMVQQMYLASNKDENQTVNLLLQHSEENQPH